MNRLQFSPCSKGKCAGLQRLPELCTYHQQSEHRLTHIEAVPPVVVRDGTVPLSHGVHPSGKNLLPKEDNTIQTLEQNAKG